MSAAKWILGGLGFVTAGPLGAILGVLIASIYDSTKAIPQGSEPHEYASSDDANTARSTYRRATQGDIRFSLLVLIACVMKADGHVKRSELDYVKQYLVRTYSESDAYDALQMLKQLLEQPLDPVSVSAQMAMHINYSTRLELLHFLFELAHADGEVADSEIRQIEQISDALHVSQADYRSLLAMYHQENPDWAYEVLEIQPGATNDEVRSAYRRMAMRYHPDKVASAGEEIQQKAADKFRKIKEAYDHIKQMRGL